MNEQARYKYYNKRNGLKWLQQGIIDKHFYKPRGKEYHYITRKIDGRYIMELDESNKYISDLIKDGKTFWLARYGHTEMTFINAVLYSKYIGNEVTPCNVTVKKGLDMICNNAGFFPHDEGMGEKYVDMVLEAAPNIDIHATWDLWMEDYMLAEYEKKAKPIRWGSVAPYYQRKERGNIPWTHALAGKKVLVINPFAESIEKQYYNNREKIFSKIYDADDILPEFELKTLKAVQTSGGTRDDRFNNWFEALEWMIEECKKTDFDIALLGCGAYGFLLANEIKKMGKSAIQTCGSTQMLFGVLGKRWTEDKRLMDEVVNEYWIRPSNSEKHNNFDKVEDGCYW